MTQPGEPCLSASQLEELLLGRLPFARALAMEAHLDGCELCLSRIADLQIESRLMTVLSKMPRRELVSPPAKLEDLMSRLEGLVPSQSTAETSAAAYTEIDGFPFLQPAQEPAELGRLGDYRVLRLLGRGGMGYVFHAEDTRLNRAVGLKVLRPRAEQDPKAHQRFLDEARAMAAVRHDHIAVIFEVSETGSDASAQSTAYLAMELLEGESLDSWMRANHQPPVEWVLRIGREAADGLAAAHAAGLIHRDIKPSNLWLEAPGGWRYEPTAKRLPLGAVGRVKLIDFGLAAPTEQLIADTPQFVGGTPGFIAPEQMRGEPVSGQADLYSLGCVLYQLCTGKHPFPGRGMFARSFVTQPTPIRDWNPRVPAALARLIGTLLSEDPADRPATAQEVVQQLAVIEKSVREAGQRKTRMKMLGSAAAVALLTVGITLLLRHRPTTEATSPTVLATPASTHGLPFPEGPPDEEWCKKIHELPPAKQFHLVARKLEELNPGFDHTKASGWVEHEAALRFSIDSNVVTDLTPLRALVDLKKVRCAGTGPGLGTLTDLSPLAGLKLHTFDCYDNPNLKDFSPLRDMQLVLFDACGTGIESLKDINVSRLEELWISRTSWNDLSSVRSMPRLQVLRCDGCPITSFEPLIGTNLKELKADIVPARDAVVLRKLPKLQTINGRPAKDFWKSVGVDPR